MPSAETNMVTGFSHLVFEITNKCDLACRQCYASSGKKFANPSLESILHVLKRLRELNTREILLSGGEPTVRTDLVAVFRYCSEIGMPIILSTNGMVDSSLAKSISRYCEQVDVSLRGSNREQFEHITRVPGSYSAMRRGIRRLSEAQASLNLNYDLTSANYRHLYDAVAELAEEGIGVKRTWVQRTSMRGRATSESAEGLGLLVLDDYHDVLEQMHTIETAYRVKCRMIDPLPLCLVPLEHHHLILESRYGYDWAAVGTEGLLRRDPVDPLSTVGSVFEENIMSSWNTDPDLQRFRSLDWLRSVCTPCQLRGKCKGGFCASTPLSEGRDHGYRADALIDRYRDLITPFTYDATKQRRPSSPQCPV